MANEKGTVELWFLLYEQGPDLEDHDCRNCHGTMTPMPESATEPTAFCHSCAQEFLELLIEKHKIVMAELKKANDRIAFLDGNTDSEAGDA
jgi:hypothetical protein